MFQNSVKFGRPALVFDATVDRLAKIGLVEARDPDRLDVSQLPPPDVLVRLLTEIASIWRRQRGEPARPGKPEALRGLLKTKGPASASPLSAIRRGS